jgi:hypothetical protein
LPRHFDVADGAYVPIRLTTDTICFGLPTDEEIGAIDPKHNISRIDYRGCSKEKQAGPTLVGTVFGLSYACRGCGCNALNALVKRHLVLRPPFVANWSPALLWFRGVPLREEFHEKYTTWTFQAWLMKWTITKVNQILRSLMYDHPRHQYVKSMVKMECGSDVPTRARLIQFYVNLLTQAETGPVTTAIQKSFVAAINNHDSSVRVRIASGMNHRELSDWMREATAAGLRKFYERDGKNWDSTMASQHHDLFIELLRQAGVPQQYIDLFNIAACVRGQFVDSETYIRYFADYTTKSGHNTTTIANSLVNAAILLCLCLTRGLRADILVAGDDALVAFAGELALEDALAFETAFGIRPVGRVFDTWRDVTFISGAFYGINENNITFAPKIGRLLHRLFWTMRPPSRRDRDNYLYSIVSSVRSTMGSFPVVRALLAAHDRKGKKVQIRGKDFTKFVDQEYDVSDIWRDVCERYRVTEAEILDLEREILRWGGRPVVLKHRIAEAFASVDLVDIGVRPTVDDP